MHDMTPEKLRTRITKFRDVRSNLKFRLQQAEEIIDFVEHELLDVMEDMAEAPYEDEEVETGEVGEDVTLRPHVEIANPEIEIPASTESEAESEAE